MLKQHNKQQAAPSNKQQRHKDTKTQIIKELNNLNTCIR
jgi:hypothetical protein